MAKSGRHILILVVMLALASFGASAQDDEHYTHYKEDFIEGTELTIELEVLDKVEFTYYAENYTFGILGISEEASTVRVEKRAFEVLVGGKLFFDFDGETNEDIAVTLLSVDDEKGMYKLELFKKVWDVPPEANETDEGNSTGNSSNDGGNSTPDDSGSDGNSQDDEQQDEEPEEEEDAEEETETEDESDEEQPEEEEKEEKSPTGGTTVNVTINFTLGEGGLVGLLIVVVIVAVGLIAYKKVRKKRFSEYEVVSTRKSSKRKKKR